MKIQIKTSRQTGENTDKYKEKQGKEAEVMWGYRQRKSQMSE